MKGGRSGRALFKMEAKGRPVVVGEWDRRFEPEIEHERRFEPGIEQGA